MKDLILASTLTNIDNELYCCSNEFLSHDPSILNIVVYIPAYDFVAHGSGFGRLLEFNMSGERCVLTHNLLIGQEFLRVQYDG